MKELYLIFVVFLDYSFALQPVQRSSSNDIFSTSRILLFGGSTYDDHQPFPLSSSLDLLNHPQFDTSKKTVLYMHGYKQLIDDENIRTVVAAYQTRNDYNILLLDWISIANGDYIFNALPNTVTFSKIMADVLIDLFTHGLDIKKFHLLSHSLGSQLAGMVGREIKKKSNGKLILKRITCLDPAFPGFYPPLPLLQAVNKDDAEFVDVIHTETGTYGTPFSTGTVDFWVNGLSLTQPGCPPRNFSLLDLKDLCGHHRSWRLWAESVSRESSKFWAQKCSTFWFFRNKCESNKFVSMGIDCPSGVTGSYYLRIRDESPFSY